MTESDRPPAKRRGKKYYCPVKDCDWQGASDKGYEMHHLTKHNAAYRARMLQSRRGKRKGKGTRSPRSGRLVDVVVRVLADHGGVMDRQELVDGVRAAGYSSSASNLGNCISGAARSHPEAGIISPARGQYQLQKGRRKSLAQRSVEPPTGDLSPEVELEILRRNKIKQEEIIMALMQTVKIALA